MNIVSFFKRMIYDEKKELLHVMLCNSCKRFNKCSSCKYSKEGYTYAVDVGPKFEKGE